MITEEQFHETLSNQADRLRVPDGDLDHIRRRGRRRRRTRRLGAALGCVAALALVGAAASGLARSDGVDRFAGETASPAEIAFVWTEVTAEIGEPVATTATPDGGMLIAGGDRLSRAVTMWRTNDGERWEELGPAPEEWGSATVRMERFGSGYVAVARKRNQVTLWRSNDGVDWSPAYEFDDLSSTELNWSVTQGVSSIGLATRGDEIAVSLLHFVDEPAEVAEWEMRTDGTYVGRDRDGAVVFDGVAGDLPAPARDSGLRAGVVHSADGGRTFGPVVTIDHPVDFGAQLLANDEGFLFTSQDLLLHSTDGERWRRVAAEIFATQTWVAHGTFVVIDPGEGLVLASSDGTTWRERGEVPGYAVGTFGADTGALLATVDREIPVATAVDDETGVAVELLLAERSGVRVVATTGEDEMIIDTVIEQFLFSPGGHLVVVDPVGGRELARFPVDDLVMAPTSDFDLDLWWTADRGASFGRLTGTLPFDPEETSTMAVVGGRVVAIVHTTGADTATYVGVPQG